MFRPKVKALLDPRPAHESIADPLMGAVNIPLGELPDRTYELPAKNDIVYIADVGRTADLALQWLQAHGRSGEIWKQPWEGGGQPRLWLPNEFLEEQIALAKPGFAIDLACGTGRDAVFLANLGWQVLAIDVLSDAIERAEALESRYRRNGESVSWRVADVSQGVPELAVADLATMFYFLDRQLLLEAIKHLPAGATLIVETFTTVHQERFGKPSPARALQPGELRELAGSMEVIHYSEEWRSSGRHTARLEARKR
jgi:SAM-dependent methyltransferase